MIADELLHAVARERVWDREPVFCFTSDIDWASEAVLETFLAEILPEELKLLTFVTHESQVIERYHAAGRIQRGIHPNFLSGSSHGQGFREIIEHCIAFAPEAIGFRSHRLFDTTDVTHLLHDEFGYKYVSNLGTVMQPGIAPVLHESGLVHIPIFFEDGTHLFHGLSLALARYAERFLRPGIKVISIHPFDYVLNTPERGYARRIKDRLPREAYHHITAKDLEPLRHQGRGIRSLVDEIIRLARKHRIMSMNEVYRLSVS